MADESPNTVHSSRWGRLGSFLLSRRGGPVPAAGRASWRRRVAVVGVIGVLALIASLVPATVVVQAIARLPGLFEQARWVEGTIPAPRGCILDKNGLPLAWSTRHFDVHWTIPREPLVAREELAILRRYLGDPLLVTEAELGTRPAHSLALKRDLGPNEVAAVARLQAEIQGLAIVSNTVRHRVADKTIQARLGDVQILNGREVGTCGEELTRNATLTGRDGRFRVMVDRRGEWVKESWQKTLDICPGYDVYLPITAEPSLAAASSR